MNHFFSVNGIEVALPIERDSSFLELLQYMKKNFSSEKTLISSIKINGSEITEPQESELAPVLLSEIESIEIFTAHPKEIAQETLQNLLIYLDILISLSIQTSEETQPAQFHQQFTKLLDGISTTTDAITSIKKLFRIGVMPTIDVLEAELLSILKDMLNSQQNNQDDYTRQLLKVELPINLEQWKTEGIPHLIRSRDS